MTLAAWAAPALGLTLLGLGLAGYLPVPLAVGIGSGLTCACFALLVMRERRTGTAVTTAGPALPPLAAALSLAGAGLFVVGVAQWWAPHEHLGYLRLPVTLALTALFLAAGAYLLGLLMLPGAQASVLGRVRRLLDGASVGLCLFYIAWLLLFVDLGLRGGGLTAVLLACIALSAALVAGLRVARYRTVAVLAGIGAATSIAALTGVTVVLDYQRKDGWLLVFGLVAVAAPVILWRGVRAAVWAAGVAEHAVAEQAVAERPRGDLAGRPLDDGRGVAAYPLLTLPLCGALVVAGYQFAEHHSFDTVSVLLSIGGIALIALREAVAVLDIRRYAVRLATAHADFRSLVAGANDVALVLDDDLLVRWQSTVAARQFALSDQEVVGRSVIALVHPEDAERAAARLVAAVDNVSLRAAAGDGPRDPDDTLEGSGVPGAGGLPFEARLRDGFGAWRETEWTIGSRRLASGVGTIVVYVRDMASHAELARSVRRAAQADRLTGLANRDELSRVLARSGRPGVLIALDLRGMSGVNEIYGHRVGDAVMVEAARRLRAETTATDVAARLDGDMFAVATDNGAVQAHLLATRLLTILSEPYAVPGALLHLTAGAGLAEVGPDTPPDEAIRRAGVAVGTTRPRTGSWAVEWYDESAERGLRRRVDLEQELPGAVTRGELDLVYQPVVELAGERPVGVEALLRWRHPRLGTVAPAEFLPVAQELGLLDEIGEWVLHWGCRQLSSWLRDGRDLWLSVNVTAAQLASPGFVPGVETVLATHQVPAARLVIEVAEPGIVGSPVRSAVIGGRTPAVRAAAGAAPLGRASVAGTGTRAGSTAGGAPIVDAPEDGLTVVVDTLAALRAMGARTAVDHFGSAATSLSQLRVLPLDLLKVDRQVFAEPAGRTGVVTAIIDVVVKLGMQIGVEVIAQGLESAADLEVARGAGCVYGQGYLLGKPEPPEHVEAWLDSRRPSRLG